MKKVNKIFKGINGDFKVLELIKVDNKKRYKIVFLDTKFEKIIDQKYVKENSIIKNKKSNTVCGVGTINTKITKEKRYVYNVWRQMLKRCYLKNYSISHKKRNITVCKDWLTFETFEKEIELIENYNYEKIINGELVLDKDKKTNNQDNIEYNLTNCCFITKIENNKININSIRLKAFNETEEIIGTSTKDLAKKINLNYKTVKNYIGKKIKTKNNYFIEKI